MRPGFVTTLATYALMAAALAAAPALLQGQEVPGYLAVYGIGQFGPWTTEVSLASRVAAPATIVWSLGPDQSICVPTPCHEFVDLPPFGSAVVGPPPPASNFIGVGYIGTDGSTLPAVQARVHTEDGTRSADLPVFSVRELRGMNVDSLSFPGAVRSPGQRCNLLIANVYDPAEQAGGSVDVEVSVIDASGGVMASRVLEIADHGQIFLVDVVGQLGVTLLDVGQVRVRKLAGDVMWGILTISRSDGSMSVATGIVP